MRSLERRTVLISGGEGLFGRELARAFDSLGGWAVSAPSHKEMDVTEESSVRRWVEGLGRLDLLIHNAGILHDQLLSRMSSPAWEEVLSVHLGGARRLAVAAYPLLKEASGHLILMGSYVGLHGAVGQSNYAAAKAALCGFSASLAREWGEENIRCNVVLPGWMQGGMTRDVPASVVDQAKAKHALGRFNTADQAALFVTVLAEMDHISGQVFQLDSRVESWI